MKELLAETAARAAAYLSGIGNRHVAPHREIGKPFAGARNGVALMSGFGRLTVLGTRRWTRGKSQPSQCPLRMFSEDRVVGGRQFRKPRAKFLVARFARALAGISNCYARIPHQAAPLGSFHRASAK